MITKVLLVLWIFIIMFYFVTGDGKGIVQGSCHHLMVHFADHSDCNGEYAISNKSVTWAPDKPVYKHHYKNRVIFWNAKGYGWSIGKTAWLVTGRHLHKSGLNSDEPWQGEWGKNLTVDCIEEVVKEQKLNTMVDINEEDNVSGTGINNSKQSLVLWCFPLLYLAQYIV